MSGGKWADGQMVHRPMGMGMGASEDKEWNVWFTDGDAIGEVRCVADDGRFGNLGENACPSPRRCVFPGFV